MTSDCSLSHSLWFTTPMLSVGQRVPACLISSRRCAFGMICGQGWVWLLSATAGSTLGPCSVAVWRRVRVLMWRRFQIGLAVFGVKVQEGDGIM
jgi:hypothetical protein